MWMQGVEISLAKCENNITDSAEDKKKNLEASTVV